MRLHRIFHLGFAISLLSLAACTKKEDSGQTIQQKVACENGQLKEVRIFGGEVLSSESILAKGMVLIYSASKEGGSFCTGSLIDSNIILTAAHCVPSKGEHPENVSIYWSVDPLCSVIQNGDQSLMRTAEEIIVHSSYGDSKTKEHGDVAMIRLNDSAPADAAPAHLVGKSEKLDAASTILVAGFGKTTDYTKGDISRQLMRVAKVKPFQAKADASKENLAKDTKDLSKEVLFLDQTAGQGACAGDSGGPSLMKLDGIWAVIGVASFVDPLAESQFKDKETTCHMGVAYSSVTYFKDWIQKTYDQLKSDKSTHGLQWVD